MEMINSFLTHWEPTWLLLVLATETTVGFITLYWIIKEYDYDKTKDDLKSQKRTKTQRKTTTKPGGESVTEETTEVTEPSNDKELPHN